MNKVSIIKTIFRSGGQPLFKKLNADINSLIFQYVCMLTIISDSILGQLRHGKVSNFEGSVWRRVRGNFSRVKTYSIIGN